MPSIDKGGMCMMDGSSKSSGAATVYLVGAGPGDPGLLTVAGAEALRRASVVVYDYLANPELLRLAPEEREADLCGEVGESAYQDAGGD